MQRRITSKGWCDPRTKVIASVDQQRTINVAELFWSKPFEVRRRKPHNGVSFGGQPPPIFCGKDDEDGRSNFLTAHGRSDVVNRNSTKAIIAVRHPSHSPWKAILFLNSLSLCLPCNSNLSTVYFNLSFLCLNLLNSSSFSLSTPPLFTLFVSSSPSNDVFRE